MKLRAIIDVGTNTLLMLIGEPLSDGTVRVIEDRGEITRLGEGVMRSKRISDAAAKRTLAVLKEYRDICERHHVEKMMAVGTAALRIAENAASFVDRVKQTLGITIEVISGNEEATFTFAAAAHDFGRNITVIDIGGGSTEIIMASSAKELCYTSIPTGSVALTEQCVTSDPIRDKEYEMLVQTIDQYLSVSTTSFTRAQKTKLIATAGTATTLGAIHLKLNSYDQARVHGVTLSWVDIERIISELKPLPLASRKKVLGLHPARADVIIAGATLLLRAMDSLGFDRVTVSDRGLRWGVFYERYL